MINLKYGKKDPIIAEPIGGQEYAGQVYDMSDVVKTLGDILVALRMNNPITSLVIDGAPTFNGIVQQQYFFMISGKHVPMLRGLLQNNSAANIFVGLGENATTGDIIIAPGGSLQINDVVLDSISLLNSAAGEVPVSRRAKSAKVASSVVLYAWGNPEWTNFWGQI